MSRIGMFGMMVVAGLVGCQKPQYECPVTTVPVEIVTTGEYICCFPGQYAQDSGRRNAAGSIVYECVNALTAPSGGGIGTACTANSQCAAGLYCSDGLCALGCSTDTGCAATFNGDRGWTCSATSICTFLCRSNADCKRFSPVLDCFVQNQNGEGRCEPHGFITCGAPLTACGANCFNLQNDPANCGQCGKACAGGQVCNNGTCGAPGVFCAQGLTLCAGACTNTNTDAGNCGGCGKVCQNGQTCVSGVCANQACPQGQTSCNGSCIDLQNDPRFCGACNIACGANQSCVKGACQNNGNGPCPQGQMKLNDGSCVSPNIACKDGSGQALPLILSCCDGKLTPGETCTDGGGPDCRAYYTCRFQGQGCKENGDCNTNATQAYPNGLVCVGGSTCQPR